MQKMIVKIKKGGRKNAGFCMGFIFKDRKHRKLPVIQRNNGQKNGERKWHT